MGTHDRSSCRALLLSPRVFHELCRKGELFPDAGSAFFERLLQNIFDFISVKTPREWRMFRGRRDRPTRLTELVRVSMRLTRQFLAAFFDRHFSQFLSEKCYVILLGDPIRPCPLVIRVRACASLVRRRAVLTSRDSTLSTSFKLTLLFTNSLLPGLPPMPFRTPVMGNRSFLVSIVLYPFFFSTRSLLPSCMVPPYLALGN